MTNRPFTRCIIIATILLGACQANAITPVTPRQQKQWLNWLIPLPKEISIQHKVVLPANEVYLHLMPTAGDVEKNAAQLLKDLFHEKAQADLSSGRFEILMGLVDSKGFLAGVDLSADAARLKTLPNTEQAYVIRPGGDNRLILAALNERGLYYGAQTLRQLFEPAFDHNQVSIPIAVVTDWPDLEQRGYWDEGFTSAQINRMAGVKYNTVNVIPLITFDKNGTPIAPKIPRDRWDLNSDFSTYCHLHAIECIPFIPHLSHLKRTGLYDYYPELLGQGKGVRTDQQKSWRAPCSSNQRFAEILAGWMNAMADYPYVNEIAAWLTEDFVYCSCPECLAKGEYVAEAMVITKAWRMAQEKHPLLKLQLQLTQGSYPTNDKVLAAIPNDMRVIYYDGGRSYDSSREPMVYPLLEKFCANGGWLSVCPQTTVSWAFIIPWSCPQFIKARMTEFADKKVHGMMGYSHPSIDPYDFNTTAAAEWTWNAHGRNEWQFSIAWATRRGFKDPQAVANWVMTLGPVSWNLYGSHYPYNLLWVNAGDLVNNRQRPAWGTDIFHYFKSAADLDKNIKICEKALAMARQLGNPEFIEENLIALNFYNMLKAISQIMTCAAEHTNLTAENCKMLQKYTQQLNQGMDNIAELLPKWAVRHDLPTDEGRIKNTIRDNRKIVGSITAAVDKLIHK